MEIPTRNNIVYDEKQVKLTRCVIMHLSITRMNYKNDHSIVG